MTDENVHGVPATLWQWGTVAMLGYEAKKWESASTFKSDNQPVEGQPPSNAGENTYGYAGTKLCPMNLLGGGASIRNTNLLAWGTAMVVPPGSMAGAQCKRAPTSC